MRHIMVATDGSPGADRAIEAASQLAKALEADLLIVTIAGSLTAEETRALARAERNIANAIESLSTQILEQARERARGLGVSKIEVMTGWGDAAQTIIDIAGAKKVDAVVLGRRGRGLLTGLLLGSVSQKVASLARCMVVVVP